ncbi:NAD(P)-binding protein [Cypionkella sp.]|uniref:NAD(P)-binding protein n=1 Tax=Cypionkella sp. TaxID=2811411 RepID=UPI00351CE08A
MTRTNVRKSTQSPPLSIGNIGAGIGGLAAAALCAQSGHRVTLLSVLPPSARLGPASCRNP